MNYSYQTGGHLATLNENSNNIYFYLFSILNSKQNKIGSVIGSCCSGDLIAEIHIHTDITIYNIEEPQQKYHLGTASNRFFFFLGGGGGGDGEGGCGGGG